MAEVVLPPAADRAIGMEFYLSSRPGVGGRTKASPDDFRVNEISAYPRPDPAGAFTVLRVTSRGWEQHELGAAIARRLNLPSRSVKWSGTKDRRAVSERLFSYRGAPPTHDLGLSDVAIVDAYRSTDGLVLGHHYGNAFEIRVSDLAAPVDTATPTLRSIESELRAAGGFPNFFGPQRFGEVRPVTHEVGRALVRGNIAEAVEVYLTARPTTGSPGAGDRAREEYATHRDARRALRDFPAAYRFERSLLERLARGDPADRAFRALPFDLRQLFVHAFQAYLFNRWLSRRHLKGFPLDRPRAGDRILRLGRDGTVRGLDAVEVLSDNEPECTELVASGKALLAGPIVGSETGRTESPVDPILRELLAEEEIDPRMFTSPSAPEIASRGTWRPALLPVPPIGVTPGPGEVWFRFALPKGSYATVLLREFLKPAEPA